MITLRNNFSQATLIVNGKLVWLDQERVDDLFENLIGQDLSQKDFLAGRSYLCEAFSPILNNLYSHFTAGNRLSSDTTNHDLASSMYEGFAE